MRRYELVGRSNEAGRWHLVRAGMVLISPAHSNYKPPTLGIHAACTQYSRVRQITYGQPTCCLCKAKRAGCWGLP